MLKAEDKKAIIALEKLGDTDYHALLELTSNPDVTKYIGNGKPWTPDKVKKFINYCIEDDNKPDKSREWFTFKITVDGEFAGIIEFKSMKIFSRILKPIDAKKYIHDVALTIYVSPKMHGRGIATEAIHKLKDIIREKKPSASRLFSMVRQINMPMHKLMAKLKFKKMYNVKMGTETLMLYHQVLNYHPPRRGVIMRLSK